MKFEMYQHTVGAFKGQWGWRLKAANGKSIAIGGESYHNEKGCIHAVNLVMSTDSNTDFKYA